MVAAHAAEFALDEIGVDSLGGAPSADSRALRRAALAALSRASVCSTLLAGTAEGGRLLGSDLVVEQVGPDLGRR